MMRSSLGFVIEKLYRIFKLLYEIRNTAVLLIRSSVARERKFKDDQISMNDEALD